VISHQQLAISYNPQALGSLDFTFNGVLNAVPAQVRKAPKNEFHPLEKANPFKIAIPHFLVHRRPP